MTECPECARAEMTRWQRLRADAREFLAGPTPYEVFAESYAVTMRVFLGAARPEPSWYEKHRARWESTGDVMELDRMCRHVNGLVCTCERS